MVAAFIILFAFCGQIFGQRNDGDSGNNKNALENDIYIKVNRQRTRRHMNMLVWDERLAEVARAYSRQMARENFFAHADPKGRMVQDRIVDTDIIQWKKVGENLFWVADLDDFGTLAVNRWMASASHRENILDREWTTTGIGVWCNNENKCYATQIFLMD
ncbi:MAG: CAP domain-containing protein [Acidobacteria bacterium]|nr:CAP domain-containing protein [Acidobacteriota bacterium]